MMEVRSEMRSDVTMDTKPAVPSGSSNTSLRAAKRAKNDEFYTQLSDVEREVCQYTRHFKGKVVYCNCDDPDVSQFVRHFIYGFKHLGLKRLIATGYVEGGRGKKLDYYGSRNATSIPDDDEVIVTELTGDGDFRSAECAALLKEADIVVTNPPFSLFREYVAQLVEYDKQFLIIGNINAITYKEIFPLIKGDKLWLGTVANKTLEFGVPESYPLKTANSRVDTHGNKFIRVPAIAWFTNMVHGRRNEELILYREYSPERYPKYDNYDAINVDKVADIPCDYTEERVVTSEELQRLRDNGFQVTVLEEL